MISDSINQTLYLASSSPRRKQILSGAGWKFDIYSAPIDEAVIAGETPTVYALRMAVSKTRTIISRLEAKIEAQKKDNNGILPERYRQSRIYVLGADTVVVDGRDILGKPRDEAEAVQMLTHLRCRIHQVYTSVALACFQPTDKPRSIGPQGGPSGDAHIALTTNLCVTDVVMRDYTDEEITEYVASGDPMDKAGAYAIQNRTFLPVRSIKGCYANVVGLPLCHVSQAFKDLDVQPPAADAQIFPLCQKMFADPLQSLDCCQQVWQANGAVLSELVS